MTSVLVDVRDFDPDGQVADVTIRAARLALSVSGSKLVSTASELVFDGTTDSFELEPDLLVRLTVTGVAGLVTPIWVEVPQTATSLAELYLNHRIDPVTAQPIPQYPSIAVAIADLAQQLADFELLDEQGDASVSAALAARYTKTQVDQLFTDQRAANAGTYLAFTSDPDDGSIVLTVGA